MMVQSEDLTFEHKALESIRNALWEEGLKAALIGDHEYVVAPFGHDENGESKGSCWIKLRGDEISVEFGQMKIAILLSDPKCFDKIVEIINHGKASRTSVGVESGNANHTAAGRRKSPRDTGEVDGR